MKPIFCKNVNFLQNIETGITLNKINVRLRQLNYTKAKKSARD